MYQIQNWNHYEGTTGCLKVCVNFDLPCISGLVDDHIKTILVVIFGHYDGRSFRLKLSADVDISAFCEINVFWPAFRFLVAAKPSNSSRGELSASFFLLSSFFPPFSPKEGQNSPKNMVVYAIWAIDFKSEVKSDLWPPRLFGGHSGLKIYFSLLVSN